MSPFEQTGQKKKRKMKTKLYGEVRSWTLREHRESVNRFAFSWSMILLPFGSTLCSFFLGYESLTVVGEAADGEAAIEMAFRLTPHVIIMDVKMPRISGVEATRRIKRISSRRTRHWSLRAG